MAVRIPYKIGVDILDPAVTGEGGDLLLDNDKALADRVEVLPQKYVELIGDGVSTGITVTHNLGTKSVFVSIREIATDEIVFAKVDATTDDTITISFDVAPTNEQFEVTVIG